MQLVTEVLDGCEKVSGQKVDKEKSVICLHNNVSQRDVIVAEILIGILRKQFLFVYLGCPIFHNRK